MFLDAWPKLLSFLGWTYWATPEDELGLSDSPDDAHCQEYCQCSGNFGWCFPQPAMVAAIPAHLGDVVPQAL